MVNRFKEDLYSFSEYSLDELSLNKYNKKYEDLTNDEVVIVHKIYMTSSVITKM